jgi:hypothetical protein
VYAVRVTSLLLLAPIVGLAFSACAPDDPSGITHRFDLPDASDKGNEGGASGAEGTGGEAGTPVQVEPPGPPVVTDMSPLSGPYGTTIRIRGEDLGSLARDGVSITIGDDDGVVLDPTSAPEIVSWSESEIALRYPFPLSKAELTVSTPEGSAVAGEFSPTWVPGPSLEIPEGVKSLASIAIASSNIAAVLDTGPPTYVEFDGEMVETREVSAENLRFETLRLYRGDDGLAGFALSTATDPEIMALDAPGDFASTPTSVEVTGERVLAGGREGASIWFRDGGAWSRARPGAGGWAIDKTGITDPMPSATKHTAGTASDGSLYVAWAEDTGDTLDDRGAAFFRRLTPDATSFLGKTRVGNDVDDSVSSLVLDTRGAGVVARYCGTDVDPLGATSKDVICYGALMPSGVRQTLKESTSLRYAFNGLDPAVAYCSPSSGVRLVPDIGTGAKSVAELDQLAGEVVAWPCGTIVAIEVDQDGEPLVILEHEGALYSPRPLVP